MKLTASRMVRWLVFGRTLKVEPFMLFVALAVTIKKLTMDQLYQDKICLQKVYELPKICLNITTQSNINLENEKNEILRTASQYQTYSQLITTLPALIVALFVGSWSDNFVSGRKILMVMSGIGLAIDALIGMINVIWYEMPSEYLLLMSLPFSLVGGMSVVNLATNAYVVRTSTDRTRVIRLTTLLGAALVGQDLGTLLGGYVLKKEPWFGFGQLRNYFGVFVLSFLFSVVSVVMVLLFIREQEDNPEKADSLIENGHEQVDNSKETGHEQIERSKVPEHSIREAKLPPKWQEALKSVFNISNVVNLFRLTLSPREDMNHRLLWPMYIMYIISQVTASGLKSIGFQFVQKTRSWDATTYGNISTLASIGATVFGVIVVSTLVRRLKVADSQLCVLTTTSLMLAWLCRGTVLTKFGFFATYFVGSLGGIQITTIKSVISTLVNSNETGSIFALLSAIETLMTLLGTYLATVIFNATLAYMPGAVYQSAVGLLFVPLIFFAWLDSR